MAEAKKKGKKLGRPNAIKRKKEDKIIKLLKQGYILIDEFGRKIPASNNKIAKFLNISYGTVASVRKKLKSR